MDTKSTYPPILLAACGVFVASVIIFFLIVAQNLLLPLVFAVLIWYLINTVDHSLARVRIKGWSPPRWLRLMIILATFAVALNTVTGIVAANVSGIMREAPDYQKSLESILQDLPFGIEIEEVPMLSQITTELNLGRLIQRIAREFAGLLGNIGLVFIYLIFLFLEERHFSNKIKAAAGGEQQRQWLFNLFSQIDHDIKRYIGIKTMLSLATAVSAWFIMYLVGLEYASFWALLIFLLNYIPNLGSIVATLIPAVLALIQFDTYPPFFIILFGLGAIQVAIGNFLDPALMGKSLNVSPLVIIISLVLWGVLWGLPGMFLCVPITVILMIILYNIKTTRWLAVLLSRDGDFKE